jgi:hypothetical protein
MKRLLMIGTFVLCAAAPAPAQTKGRVGVGGSVTWIRPTDGDLQSLVGFGPLVRLNPKKGWGIAGGLSWFRADVDNPSGAGGPFGTLQVRPLMGGISYTIGEQPLLVSFSVVAGPSFNTWEFDDDFLRTLPPSPVTPDVSIKTSFAARTGVGLTYSVAPRVGIIGFVGYMYNHPHVTYRSPSGEEFHNRWKSDSIHLSVGAVYSLF